MDRHTDRQTTDRQTDKLTDGQTDGRMDGRTDIINLNQPSKVVENIIRSKLTAKFSSINVLFDFCRLGL